MVWKLHMNLLFASPMNLFPANLLSGQARAQDYQAAASL